MREFTPVNPDLAPLEQENIVLSWFQESGVTSPKKLVKMAEKIAHLVPDFIHRSIIRNVLIAKAPHKFLAEAYREMADYPVIMAGLIADGNHGMLMVGDNIYGLVIDARWSSWLKQNDRWNTEQEIELQDQIVDDWVEEKIIRNFEGRIVLFRDFGFSGMARKMTRVMNKEHYDKLKADYNTLVHLQKSCE